MTRETTKMRMDRPNRTGMMWSVRRRRYVRKFITRLRRGGGPRRPLAIKRFRLAAALPRDGEVVEGDVEADQPHEPVPLHIVPERDAVQRVGHVDARHIPRDHHLRLFVELHLLFRVGGPPRFLQDLRGRRVLIERHAAERAPAPSPWLWSRR